jgi:hypothetical protein
VGLSGTALFSIDSIPFAVMVSATLNLGFCNGFLDVPGEAQEDKMIRQNNM